MEIPYAKRDFIVEEDESADKQGNNNADKQQGMQTGNTQQVNLCSLPYFYWFKLSVLNVTLELVSYNNKRFDLTFDFC